MKNSVRYISIREIALQDDGDKVFVAGAFGHCGVNRKGDTSTRDAIARILADGEALLRHALTTYNISLPTNWGGAALVHDVDGGMSWFGWRKVDGKVFETAARRAGWMREMAVLIAEHPEFFRKMVVRVAKSPSRGMNSPANKGAWDVVRFLTGASLERWRTPGHAMRTISKAIWKARWILAPWEIESVPWVVVLDELSLQRGAKRSNKIAKRLAKGTLNHNVFTGGSSTYSEPLDLEFFRGFRPSTWKNFTPAVREYFRQNMAKKICFRDITVPEQTTEDGVVFLREGVINQIKGYSLVEGYTSSSEGRGCRLEPATLVVSPSGRTYHISNTAAGFAGKEVSLSAGNSWSGWGDHFSSPLETSTRVVKHDYMFWWRYFIRLAHHAWRRQDVEAKASGLEVPKNCTVLVFVQDSLDAGNCEAGTGAFVERSGWHGRKFVPVKWLINSREQRAVNTAKAALRRFYNMQNAA
ncbi:MAG: hypothetical protein KBD47_03290 [Candidatus Pacebacteria bacterium]|nr:hypothetical protein [Candidatus Paceibacterota bacterium]